MTTATKLTIIALLSVMAFCAWSVAWMGLAVYRMLRDAI